MQIHFFLSFLKKNEKQKEAVNTQCCKLGDSLAGFGKF